MLTVGDIFPSFSLTAVAGGSPPLTPQNSFLNLYFDGIDWRVNGTTSPGDWKILFSWPKDFTFICPTEIKAFGDLEDVLVSKNTSLFGMSTDTDFVHLAWPQSNKDLANSSFLW